MTATGTDWLLEQLANDILAEDRRQQGDFSLESRKYILSPEQLDLRAKREVSCDPHTFGFAHPGQYSRSWNPLAGTRPKHWWSQVGDPQWDNRVPFATSTTTNVWTGNQWARSKAFAQAPRQGEFHHLTSGQRSRIRRLMRQVSGRADAREAMKVLLAEKYGVPPWIISRVTIATRNAKRKL